MEKKVDGAFYLDSLQDEVMLSWRQKSRNALYRTDPEAWLYDVLGFRWHKKQREMVWDFVGHRRTAYKSSNGSGKSRGFGELISWGIATHEPGELLVIGSGPTLRQIEETMFAYLAANMSRARARGIIFPGYLTDSTHWNYRETPTAKAKTLVLGQRPGDRDIVGSFQGIRAIGVPGAKTWVVIDEGGAVHPDLFVAAEAVTTGAGDNKIATIGNPDNVGTYFQKIFEDPKISQDWATGTIAAFDLPTFTGEIVYPDDPEMQAAMLKSGMIDREWVEQKKRAWGEDSARYLSKVLGQFPDVDDRSFFSQNAINTAGDTQIPDEPELPLVMGLDVARFGEDDSVMYANRNGRIRKHDSWAKATTNETSVRAHQQMLETDATALVIDSAGLGAGVFDQISAHAERFYAVVGANGAERSPDPTRWANARAYWYDMFREGMLTGKIDLDLIADDRLREELLVVQFDFTPKGAIKIESKKEMAARGVKSPDALDAAVYSYVDAMGLIADPLSQFAPGDKVVMDPFDDYDPRGMPV
jgi:hypothetical protein